MPKQEEGGGSCVGLVVTKQVGGVSGVVIEAAKGEEGRLGAMLVVAKQVGSVVI